MPFNGSGTFVPLAAPDYPAVTGTTISSTAFNNYTVDLMANGLSKVLVRDGQAAMTGNLNFGGFRGTNLAAPVAASDAATLGTLGSYALLTGASFTGGLNVNVTGGAGLSLQDGANSRFWVNAVGNALYIGASGTTIPAGGAMSFSSVGDIGFTAPSQVRTALGLGTAATFASTAFLAAASPVFTGTMTGPNYFMNATAGNTGYSDASAVISYFSGASGTPNQITFQTAAVERMKITELGINFNLPLTLSTALAVANGGTGATTAAGARSNLGLGSIATANVTASTAAPSGGADGDIWLRY